MRNFTPFDSTRDLATQALRAEAMPEGAYPLYLVRNLHGRVRVSVSADVEADEGCRAALSGLAERLATALGAHGYPADEGISYVDAAMLAALQETAKEIPGLPQGFWVERLMTGEDWWTVDVSNAAKDAKRYTLYSVKGGVGRTTTASVLAWHMAREGERVLLVDLDLESPGVSTAILDSSAQPEFGVADWFVEDLVGQGESVLERMVAKPSWPQEFEGDVFVAPAHGMKPGEYLAKLGRVYMGAGDSWSGRLRKLLNGLEERCAPTVVLLESRSGLHDIAAATVTDIEAQVLLFGLDSESSWADYGVLFRHWQAEGLATKIRERLSIVSALTPPEKSVLYLEGFRERSWDLFRRLYDSQTENIPSVPFSFDVDEALAPHQPMPVYWNQGFAAGTSLRQLDEAALNLAYTPFLKQFDELMDGTGTVAKMA